MSVLPRRDRRPLLVVAHVDDDGIGFGIGLRDSAPGATVVYLTDSVPRDPRYFTSPSPSREAYAAQRRREAETVAARLGLRAGALAWLGAVDMEAYRELPRLDRELTALAAQTDFDAIWSPAYDGGHPDHDVAAFLAARLARRTGRPHFQFALYRYAGGFDPFRFGAPPEGEERRLDEEALAFKRELAAAYVSQAAMLRRFDLRVERYRPAPAHDFGRRPVAGPTLYETWRWPVTADMLVAAFAALDAPG